jgi:FtsH-binding integral membrane protein
MTMPLSVLVVLIAALTIGMVVVLRPLRVISAKEFAVSHAFIVVGLAIILGWFWSNRDKFLEATMIMGGIWTLFGGLCLATVYVLRRKGE